MSPKLAPRLACIRLSLAFFLYMTAFNSQPLNAQNQYPASGDALIHGLTIGTGAGSGPYNTALGASALSSNNNGFSNVAVGNSALLYNTNGYWNTAIGANALYYNTTGTGNTATGAGAMDHNTTGYNNSANGYETLLNNSTGSNNTAYGLQSLLYNTTGSNNVAVGMFALAGGQSGNSNVAIGYSALENGNSGSNQVAIGDSSLFINSSGLYNTAVGDKTLYSNSTGNENTALGFRTLFSNTQASYNTATGFENLYKNQTGSYNSAFGIETMYSNTTGQENTGGGYFTLYANTTGSYNTALGTFSLYENTTGQLNSAYGMETLLTNTTGSYNTGIGDYANVASGGLSNATAIGADATVSASNSVMIGSSSVTSIGGYANWTNFSDGRYKRNIARNVPGLLFINKLQPITYTLDINGIETKLQSARKTANGPDGKPLTSPADDPTIKQAMQDKASVIYTGFIAQDVYKAAQSVGYNFSGVDKPKDDQQSFYGLRYSDFVVPLVKAVQELSAANDSLVTANNQLSARLDQIEQILGINSKEQNVSSLSLTSARLFQNVPNPFNQTTLINYYIPSTAGSAFIRISGMNGELIKSVALNGNGSGQVSLQTAQLAAGTYTYSLFVDGALVDTKQMILLK